MFSLFIGNLFQQDLELAWIYCFPVNYLTPTIVQQHYAQLMFTTPRNSYVKSLKSLRAPNFYTSLSHFRGIRPPISNPAIQFILDEIPESQSPETPFVSASRIEEKSFPTEKDRDLMNAHVSHPWPEWIDFMAKLLKDGYFDATGNPFARNAQLGHKEANLIRTACLNFARDHDQLMRYLSHEDILVIAGNGCPSLDRKVVNSGKRLRVHVGSNEEKVCSSCSLRGECDRAYSKVNRNVSGRTVDVMRFLLTYGLDPVVNSVSNKACSNKMVEESVRKLLKQMRISSTASERNSFSRDKATYMEQNQIHASTRPDNWICSKCDFHNSTQNINCLRCGELFHEKLRKVVEEEPLPLKKGDWICKKCNLLNFARNTRCFQCKEKPPKRHLNPGEWECESCNYINFRRNMICLKCDHKRPIASNAKNLESQYQRYSISNHHQAHPWFEDNNQTKDGSRKALDFVKNDNPDRTDPALWKKVPGFLDFPVVGGKSEVSCDIQKQQMWRMEMINKKIGTAVPKREGINVFNHSISRKKGKHFTFCDDDDDDDDEMAAWFGGGKKT